MASEVGRSRESTVSWNYHRERIWGGREWPREPSKHEDRELPAGTGQMQVPGVPLIDTRHFREGMGKAKTASKFNTRYFLNSSIKNGNWASCTLPTVA